MCTVRLIIRQSLIKCKAKLSKLLRITLMDFRQRLFGGYHAIVIGVVPVSQKKSHMLPNRYSFFFFLIHDTDAI